MERKERLRKEEESGKGKGEGKGEKEKTYPEHVTMGHGRKVDAVRLDLGPVAGVAPFAPEVAVVGDPAVGAALLELVLGAVRASGGGV